MAGFVDSFLNAFMGAKQLEDQRRRDEERSMRAAVDDWLKMEEMRQNERYRRDQLKSQDEDRKARKLDREADNARMDSYYAAQKADKIADNTRLDAKDAETAKRDRIKARSQFQGMGFPTGQAMSSAGYTPDEINAELTPVLQQRNAAIDQRNMGAMGQNAFAQMVPALAQMMAGGLPIQTPQLPEQPMQLPATMNDVMGEVAPIFQQKDALNDARIGNLQSQMEHRANQDQLAMQKMEADAALKQTQMKLNEARAADIPKARLSMDAYRNGILDHQKVMEGIAKLNGEYRRGGADRQLAVTDAKNMRDWYAREDKRLEDELKPLREEERKQAAEFMMAGETIARIFPARKKGDVAFARSITDDALKELESARTLWAVGEKRLPEITGRIKELEAKQKQNRDALRALSGIGEVPVTPSGTVKPVAKVSGMPRINTNAEAARLPSGTKFIGPDGKVYTKP